MDRRTVTPEEIAEHIERLEKLPNAEHFKGTIELLKSTLAGVRSGEVKIFQRIPAKMYKP